MCSQIICIRMGHTCNHTLCPYAFHFLTFLHFFIFLCPFLYFYSSFSVPFRSVQSRLCSVNFHFLAVSVFFVIFRLSSFLQCCEFPIIQISFTFIFRLFWSPVYDIPFISLHIFAIFISFRSLFVIFHFLIFVYFSLQRSVVVRPFPVVTLCNFPFLQLTSFSEFPLIPFFFIFVIFHVFKSLLFSVRIQYVSLLFIISLYSSLLNFCDFSFHSFLFLSYLLFLQ